MKLPLVVVILISASAVQGNPIKKLFGMPSTSNCCQKPCPEPCQEKCQEPCPPPPTEPPTTTEAPCDEPTTLAPEEPCPEPCPEPKCEEKCPEPCPTPCPEPCPCPAKSCGCPKKSKKVTIDPCAKRRAKTKMAKIGKKGLKLAKILTAGLAAPFVIGAAKATALASAIPIVMAAKGALLGKAIALPIKIMAFKTAALATGIAGLTVGVPVAIGTGIAAGAAGLKETIKGMRKVESSPCCRQAPCLDKTPCEAVGLPETDPDEAATDSPVTDVVEEVVTELPGNAIIEEKVVEVVPEVIEEVVEPAKIVEENIL